MVPVQDQRCDVIHQRRLYQLDSRVLSAHGTRIYWRPIKASAYPSGWHPLAPVQREVRRRGEAFPGGTAVIEEVIGEIGSEAVVERGREVGTQTRAKDRPQTGTEIGAEKTSVS